MEALENKSSKQLLHWILNTSKACNGVFNEIGQHLINNYDIAHALTLRDSVKVADFNYMFLNCLDGEPCITLVFNKNNNELQFSFARKSDNSGETYETATWRGLKIDNKVLRHLDKNQANYVIIVIDMLLWHKRPAKQYRAFNVDYAFNKRKMLRQCQVAEVKYAKTILASVNEFDTTNESITGIDFQHHLAKSIDSMYCNLKKWMPDVAQQNNFEFTVKVTDFELEVKSDDSFKLFCEAICQWSCFDTLLQKSIKDKYCQFIPLTQSIYYPATPSINDKLIVAANIALVQCMMQFVQVFQQMFVKDFVYYHLFNARKFDKSLLEQFGIYRSFGIVKRFITE